MHSADLRWKRKTEMIEKIKYAIFDMDGTLIDSLGYWEYLWGELGRKYLGVDGFMADTETDRTVRTITLTEASEFIKEKYFPMASAKEIYDFAIEILKEHYGNRVSAKEGTLEFLEHLRAMGVKMCVASATEPGYINYALERCGLNGFFEFVISCAEVGAGKEKPDVFLEALRRLGGDISEACVFEDSYVALETAKTAGFMTVGVFDKNNYNQDRLCAASNFYVANGMTVMDVLK